MKGNVWLAGYLVFTALLIGGAGFYFYTGFSDYGEKFDGWDNLSTNIKKKEKEVPYPNKENEEALSKLVEEYSGKVDSLYQSLARYQKDLNLQLSDSDFTTTVLAEKRNEFLRFAAEKNFEIQNRDNFYMAMEAYRSTFPRPKLVPMLDFQLGAIDHLLRDLGSAGAEKLLLTTREELPGESGDATDEQAVGVIPGQVVQKYPINLRFIASHAAFQDFLNKISNDDEYFFIVRLLRIENSSPEGPNLSQSGGGLEYVNESGESAPQEVLDQVMSVAVTPDEQIAAMAEKGYTPRREDARILFGQETLEVFMVIDLVRFLPPDEKAEEPANGEKEEDKK